MSLRVLLPARARVALERMDVARRRLARRSENKFRPVASSRHSPSELVAFSRVWAERRKVLAQSQLHDQHLDETLVRSSEAEVVRTTTDSVASPSAPVTGCGAVHAVTFAQSGQLLQVPDTQTLLEAGLAAGIPMAHSCQVGGCGTCRVRLASGDVVYEDPNSLSPEEEAEGYALACVARPCSAVVIEDYPIED